MINYRNILLLALVLAGSALANDAEVRGITISTHGIGRDWGTDAIVPTLEDIRAVGANWVAIHPYASIRADGTLRWSEIDPADPPAHIVRPIREAHRLGLRICIKPHIAYWRSPFSWRGEIAFTRDEDWQRFWRSYREWIALLATVCREADGFVVGTELDRMLTFEEEWRAIIAEVRQRTDAPLTYAANWTDYRQVPFWDALDVIGIQAYFPLTDDPAYDEEDIRAGWAERMGNCGPLASDTAATSSSPNWATTSRTKRRSRRGRIRWMARTRFPSRWSVCALRSPPSPRNRASLVPCCGSGFRIRARSAATSS